MKKIIADLLIALLVVSIIVASERVAQEPSAGAAEAAGRSIGFLADFIGLYYSARWRMKLAGHTYKVGRQTAAVVLFWYSALAIVVGFVEVVSGGASRLAFGAVMAAIWSISAYACWRWLRRLRAEERGAAVADPLSNATSVLTDDVPAPSIAFAQRYRGSLLPKLVFALTFALSLYIALAEKPFSFFFTDQSIDQGLITQSVVNVFCSSVNGQDTGGSGTLLTADGVVITNSHVIPQNDSQLLTTDNGCLVVLPSGSNGQPGDMYWARPIVIPGLSDKYDLAYLRIYSAFVDEKGITRSVFPRTFPSMFGEEEKYDEICKGNGNVKLGDPIRVFGYPQTSGGLNLTVTDGIVSSIDSDGSILTSAKVDAGNSGGLAVDKRGCMVGVPSAVSEGLYQNLGVIIPTARVMQFSDAVSKLQDSK